MTHFDLAASNKNVLDSIVDFYDIITFTRFLFSLSYTRKLLLENKA